MRRAVVFKHTHHWVANFLISQEYERWGRFSVLVGSPGAYATWQGAMDAAERWVRP